MASMKQSQLFTKTRKEAPRDEEARNAQLLIRAGFIHKEMAGVYDLLPLGLRVVRKIENIIRDEMDGLGALEIQSSALQKKEAWEQSGRWNDEIVDNWFKTELKSGQQLGLAFTHEEAITSMMKSFISSYRDLPIAVYDIRTIFRNEERAKSGLMRGREFNWKALYSFARSKEEHDTFYEKVKDAYLRIYEKLGLGGSTYLTYALGGSFSPYSHEFQTLSEVGEDTIYISDEQHIAVNEEALNEEVLKDLSLSREELREAKAVEVGNIFSLGEKFSRALNLTFKDENGTEQFVYMGSYGIGITRLVGVIAETMSDERGFIWPESIAPFQVHLLVFGENDTLRIEAENLYHDLKNAGIEVLYDDRSARPGEKLADADLFGIPYRVVLSERSKEQGGVELKERKGDEVEYIAQDRLLAELQQRIETI